jgi:uncharacterized RDD family membrane protein YckC
MSARPLADLLAVCIPPTLWFMHFGVLYGAEALLCTPPAAGRGAMIWIGALFTAATLAALAWFALGLRRPSRDGADQHSGAAFLRSVGLLLALLAALGVVWTALPVAALPVCANPSG